MFELIVYCLILALIINQMLGLESNKKRVRPERLELPTARSGVERATNCAIAPKMLSSHEFFLVYPLLLKLTPKTSLLKKDFNLFPLRLLIRISNVVTV